MSKSKTSSQTKALQLAFWDLPLKVRRYGLQEAHTYPLVSSGRKHGGQLVDVHRAPAAEAWQKWASLELTRSATAIAALAFDCDGQQGTERAMDWFQDHPEYWFNWAVTRLASGGTHFVMNLAKPVLIGDQAREAPLAALARSGEYIRQQLGGDAGYGQMLSHNPMSCAQGGRLRTKWGRREPFTLAELQALIPHGWRRPQLATTDAGRNCDVFRTLLRWAGSPANLHVPVIEQALALYQQLPAEHLQQPHPFTLKEIEGIARSVERRRQGWIAKGDFGAAGDVRRSAWGSRRGRRSGLARRKRTRDRDGAIVNGALLGKTAAELASEYGIARRTVGYVLQRDVPLMRRRGRGRPFARGEDVSERTKRRRRARVRKMLAGRGGHKWQ